MNNAASLYDMLSRGIITRETFYELIRNWDMESEPVKEKRNPKYDIYPYGVDDLVVVDGIYQKL